MLLVFGLALLVVAGVVVLFAMIGELASRIPDPAANRPVPIVEPYEDTDLGRVPRLGRPSCRTPRRACRWC